MATERCKKCGSLVEAKAKKCHICGAKMVRTTRFVKFLSVVFAGFLLVTCYAGLNSRHSTSPSALPTPATDEQIKAAEEKRLTEYAKNPKSAPYGSLPASANAPIRDGALEKYSKAGHPKLHKAWGDAGFKVIEQQQKVAAEYVARSGRCDAVYIVGLDLNQSRSPDKIVNFVECENGLKFYFGPNNPSSPLRSEYELALSQDSAIASCKKMIRSEIGLAGQVSFSPTGINAQTHKTNGNTSVFMRFEVSGGNGAKSPMSAYCSFPNRGEATVAFKDL